jgi:acyl-CoA synthetase (AMP-forming)/AMP-acid ligase II
MSGTLGDLVLAAAERSADGLAVADALGGRLTWAELERGGNRLARGLLALGLQRGDRIVAIAEDRCEYVVLHAAAAKAGLVLVPVNWRFRAREVRDIARHSGAAAIAYSGETAGTVLDATDGLDGAPRLIELDDRGSLPRALPAARIAAGQSDASFEAACAADLIYIAYTSGTTGTPKGVMADHRGCRLGADVAARTFGMRQYGATAMGASLSFTAAVIAHVWSSIHLSTAVLLLGRYDVERQLAAVEAERATFMYVPTPAVPEATRRLADRPDLLGHLATVNVGASPIPAPALQALLDVAGDRVLESYSLTEALGVPLTGARRDDFARAGLGTVGRAFSPAVVRERDGELVCRTPVRMLGYWQDAGASAAALHDGWLRTGDLASVDADGFVTIQGRGGDMIVSGGLNVYPAEVEAVVHESPRVHDCAIVGGPHERWGEAVVAFVTASGPAEGLAEHVRAFSRERIASYKCPVDVIVVDELPRNANGKILRHVLRDRLRA